MYPNIARLKGYTYASCIFCNIGIEFIDNVKETKTIKNFQRLNIGLLPIMIKSKNCILNGLDDTELTELGELISAKVSCKTPTNIFVEADG
jgi:DNA-directed RNA polymerase beta subunit